MLSYSESAENLNAFLDFVYECGIRMDRPGYTLISDRGSAIISSVTGRFHSMKHHFCSKHLERNLKSKGWTAHLSLYWRARNAISSGAYLAAMNELKLRCSAMYTYLSAIENWSLFELTEAKPMHMIFGMQSSNLVESKANVLHIHNF
jgi:hypothetical protein